MGGFTKLYSSLVDSTIWRESKETKIVWITMLAKTDKFGVVEASLPGLADAARVTLEECLEALKVLMAPDQYSRSREFQGRRVAEVDGGWQILNYAKYRSKLSEEDRREYQAAWMKEYRKRKKAPAEVVSGKQGGAGQAIREGFEDGKVLQGIPHEQDQDMQLRDAAPEVGELVSGVSREAHAGMAKNSPTNGGTTDEKQREELRPCVSEARQADGAAVPLRENSGDAPPGPHEAGERGLAVPGASSRGGEKVESDGSVKFVRP